MTESRLVRIGIGGVQAYISQARSTRDLAAGSRLVSMAAGKILEAIENTTGVELLLPDFSGGSRKACPNQLMLRVEGNPNELKTAMKALVDAARTITTGLEISWAAVPEEERGYAEDFKTLGRAWDARKHTRTFQQLQVPGRFGRACSLCGRRSSISRVTTKDRVEDLCSICKKKRDFGFTEFLPPPSTHGLALARLIRAGETVDDEEELADAVKDEHLRHLGLSPYYVIMALDGDHMGRWFSGEKGGWRADLLENQRDLSRKLAAFASAIRQLSDETGAYTVYAGGDDALILAPLDALFRLCERIHEDWKNLYEGWTEYPSISLHASVVHAKQPLQPVLGEVRNLLEQTKHRMDRNALSIRVLPRGGSEALAMLRWDELGIFQSFVEALGNWEAKDSGRYPGAENIAVRTGKSFPTRLPHSMEAVMGPFFDADGKVRDSASLGMEWRRIHAHGGGRPDDRRWEKILSWLLETRAKYGNTAVSEDPFPRGEEAVKSVLRSVPVLARELSWGPGKPVDGEVFS